MVAALSAPSLLRVSMLITALAVTGCSKPVHLQELTVGSHRLQVEIARNEKQMLKGLSNRNSLPENSGMLFVFIEPFNACFWMRNTLVPLDVAFLDANGLVVKLDSMQANSDVLHCADRAVSAALEVNSGWFASRGVTIGARVAMPPSTDWRSQ